MELLENKRIQKLSQQTSNKIAAGEVVDRPVSIIKELLENSIDAGSTSIIIEIKQGGKSYIRVTDDGKGILPEDVELAFERHATSKIIDAEDLNHITSLGFRGEALASIAAVSHTEIITKTRENKAGIQLKLDGGMVSYKKEIGCTDGTTIIISDLFYNTPARLKFLKQDATEANMIIDLVSKISLAFPFIKFRMINNSKILFSTTGTNDIYKNIISIYNKEIAHNLIKVSEVSEAYDLEAYISPPSETRTNKKYQIFFLNGRYIKSTLIDRAVNQSYKELIMEGRYPIVFVFLKVKPELVDVNIHPNKREVRFREENAIEAFINTSIMKALRSSVSIPSMPTIKTERVFQEKSMTPIIEKEEQVNIKSLSQTIDKTESPIIQTKVAIKEPVKTPYVFNNKRVIEEKPVKVEEQSFNMTELQILGTVFGTYIAACDSENFYLIDQHAAHERVLYEQLLNDYYNQKISSQRLISPYIIDGSVSEVHNTLENIDFIRGLGYEIEEFGNNAFVIKAIPSMLELTESKYLLEELIENMIDEPVFSDKNAIEKIISRACKKAVKANDSLHHKEIISLIGLLSKTKNPYSCPHGRPVFIKLSEKDIEKMFKRI